MLLFYLHLVFHCSSTVLLLLLNSDSILTVVGAGGTNKKARLGLPRLGNRNRCYLQARCTGQRRVKAAVVHSNGIVILVMKFLIT